MKINIGEMPLGQKPPGFTEALTGQGDAVSWQVLEDPGAPARRVIAETSRDTADYRFPLCIWEGLQARDVKVTVWFKAVDGSVDQAGGIVVRLQDADNYYVKAVWHTLELRSEGEQLEVSFNGHEPDADSRPD